ncbi:pollen-specific leucine-rich repeat extensin-like protein 3 [Iris pallida]|uniref:Pollen-specific leucine-rich repeat extensin-like protein 3 n=1 Tax=Iris pallida TaxID=29817 RepID=A0AAX6HXI5_IRIPA|nr:pollen-specific leucine-rich repeat extensin-like protein 3 [Iris pallida]
MAATLAVLCRRASPEPPASSILTNDRHPPFIPFHRPPSPTSSPSPPPQHPHLHHHHHPLSIPTKPPPPRREPSQASPPFQPPAEPGLTAIVGRSKASTATTNHIPSMSTRSRSEQPTPHIPSCVPALRVGSMIPSCGNHGSACAPPTLASVLGLPFPSCERRL